MCKHLLFYGNWYTGINVKQCIHEKHNKNKADRHFKMNAFLKHIVFLSVSY
jgi:hypothetical protein